MQSSNLFKALAFYVCALKNVVGLGNIYLEFCGEISQTICPENVKF